MTSTGWWRPAAPVAVAHGLPSLRPGTRCSSSVTAAGDCCLLPSFIRHPTAAETAKVPLHRTNFSTARPVTRRVGGPAACPEHTSRAPPFGATANASAFNQPPHASVDCLTATCQFLPLVGPVVFCPVPSSGEPIPNTMKSNSPRNFALPT